MNPTSLKQFLVSSNESGYAGGNEKQWVKEPDGSTTISYQEGDFRIHDNFFGGEPYGGREVVFYNEKAQWMMVYYGWVIPGIDNDMVYGILRNALIRMPSEYPYRGPAEYIENEFRYANKWEGEIERFSGEEQIFQNDKLIYKANYMGGLVDQTSGI